MRLALLCLVLLRVVIAAGMPHKYSAEKLGLRRQRALDFGFVHAVPKGHSVMYVPTDLKKRAAAQVRQLAVHRGRVLASATPWYKTSEAIQGTRAQFTTSENQKAQRIKKAADSAWHDWKDLVPSSLPSSSGAAKTSHSLPLSRVAAWADLADEDEFPLLKTSTLPSSSVSDTRSKVEETEACALIDLEEQMPTEEQMPNDSDRTTEAFDRGALPELAGKLKQRRAAIGEAVDIGRTSCDFGHLQTFYLPRAHVDGIRETQKLEDRIAALEKDIEDATQAKIEMAAQLHFLSQQFLSAAQEKDMQILQLQAHTSSFSRGGNFVSFSCDGNGCSLNEGIGFPFSCEGNGSQNSSHGNYSAFVPLDALSDGPRALAEDSALQRIDTLESTFKADLVSMHHSFQNLRAHLDDKLADVNQHLEAFRSDFQNDANKLWQARLDDIQDTFQGRVEAIPPRLQQLETRIPGIVDNEVKKNLFDERINQLSKNHGHLREEIKVSQNLVDERLLELSRNLQTLDTTCVDRFAELKDQVLVRDDTRAEGPHSDGHSAMTGQPVSSYTGNVKTGTCQPCTSDLLARFAALQDKKQKDSEEAGEEKADKKKDKSDKLEDTIVVDIDTRAEGPHSDGHSAMTGQPVSSYTGNVKTGTLRDKDLMERFAAVQNRTQQSNKESIFEKTGEVQFVQKVDMGIYVRNSILEDKSSKTSTFKHDEKERDEASTFRQRHSRAVSLTDSDDGLSSQSATESQALASRILDEGYNPYELNDEDLCDSPLHTDEDQGFDSRSDEEPWS